MIATTLDTAALASWYRRNRTRSEAIFDLIEPSAYYSRPIALRNPDRVLRRASAGVQRAGVPAARASDLPSGRTPGSRRSSSAVSIPTPKPPAVPRSGASTIWPSRDEVRAFARACDEAVLAAIDAIDAIPAGDRRAVYRARARGDAPGDAPLYVASPAARAEARAASRRRLRAWRARPPQYAQRRRGPPGAPRDAWRFNREAPWRLAGITNSGEQPHRDSRLRYRRLQRDQRRLPRVRRTLAANRPAREWWSEPGWQWRHAGERDAPGVLAARRRAALAVAVRCSRTSRCRKHGRST